MAHVYAARACLPAMIKKGGGYFLQIISAAGLLSQIGNAAYSTTKHASIGFAEALFISHVDDGIKVSVVCPQYVATSMIDLDYSEVHKYPEDILSVSEVAEVVVQGLKDELIDVIVSDHKPEDEESKRLTFSQAATGASGIETLLSLSLELYHNGSLKLETIIKALTSNPAKILKINKGNLSIGNDADLCIVDIDKPWIVKKEKLVSKSKNTSIEDKKLQGKVTNTFVKGKELFKI